MNGFAPAVLRGAAKPAPTWTYSGELFAVQHLDYECFQTETTSIDLSSWSLLAMERGTWLFERSVLPARHLALVPPGHHVLTAAAGKSAAAALLWHPRALPWLDGLLVQNAKGVKVAPGVIEVGESRADPLSDVRGLGMLLERITHVLESHRSIWLRPSPLVEASAFSELLIELERSPARLWHLQEAADAAGYSPFHFSRTFKQVVGCGFHEYVDRLRTEIALGQLCAGVPVSEAASAAGFSSTRSLRESLKDYLGLMPSDLRCTD